MFKIKRDYDTSQVIYYDSKKLKSGKTIKIEFTEEVFDNVVEYSIWLTTSRKRKNLDNQYLTTNNKDGLQGLLWAKQKIGEFEKYLQYERIFKDKKRFIIVEWDDNRRRNVYYRGLKGLGFEFKHIGYKALVKEVV